MLHYSVEANVRSYFTYKYTPLIQYLVSHMTRVDICTTRVNNNTFLVSYMTRVDICVTFVVYRQLAPNSDVSTAFWVTLKHDAACVVMAAHEY